MKAWIETNPVSADFSAFASETAHAAWTGFVALGVETGPLSAHPDHPTRNDLVAGSITAVKTALQQLHISVPGEIDYPEMFRDDYGRSIHLTTISEAMKNSQYPFFVKPSGKKLFKGKVICSQSDWATIRLPAETPVWISEAVDFVSEWRCYVRYGKILDVRPYSGSWKNFPNAATIERCIAEAALPAGCCVDFGVTKDGQTLVVEMNDGYSIVHYGLDARKYALLLTARWAELAGIPDPFHLVV